MFHSSWIVFRLSLRRLQTTARGRAVVGLLRIEQDGAYAALLSHSSPSHPRQQTDTDDQHVWSEHRSDNAREAVELPSGEQRREARQTTWLVAGATKWRRQLDVIISSLLQRSTDDLDAAVRQVPSRRAPSLGYCLMTARAAPDLIRRETQSAEVPSELSV